MTACFNMSPPPTLAPDPELRSALLEYYLKYATSAELTDWLRNIGQETKGTVDEKRARIRAHTQYLTMPSAAFPDQTLYYLEIYSAAEHLEGICETLRLDPHGTRDMRWRRIMREIGFREGWLSRPPPSPLAEASFLTELVRPFVEWHIVGARSNYEKGFYQGFYDDMEEIFGESYVHDELPIASGTTLKIDFHLGHPQRAGVGIEFKMPSNNADLQRALGQMDQYQARYGENLLVVLFPDLIDKAKETLFIDKLSEKGIAVIVK